MSTYSQGWVAVMGLERVLRMGLAYCWSLHEGYCWSAARGNQCNVLLYGSEMSNPERTVGWGRISA